MMVKAFRYFTGFTLLFLVMMVLIPVQAFGQDQTGPVIADTPQPDTEILQSTTSNTTEYFFEPVLVSSGAGGIKWHMTYYPTTDPTKWLSIDPVTGILTGTPTNDDVGVYTEIEIFATDDKEKFDKIGPFQIEVVNENDPPERITTSDPGEAKQGTPYTYSLLVKDVDGKHNPAYELKLTPTTKPFWLGHSWLKTSDTTWELSLEGYPENDDVGQAELDFTISDGKATISFSPTLTVTDKNDEPIYVGDTPLASVNEDSEYSFTFEVQEIDMIDTTGDGQPDTREEVNVSSYNLPDWLKNEDGTPAWTGEVPVVSATDPSVYEFQLSGTPVNSDVEPSPYNISLVFEDSRGGQVEVAYALSVYNTNDPPSIIPPENQTFSTTEDTLFEFKLQASDPDVDIDGNPDILTYSIDATDELVLNRLLDWANFNKALGTLSGTPLNDHVGTYNEIFITVNDGSGEPNGTATLFGESGGLTIEVTNNPDRPIITDVDAPNATQGETYNFAFSVNDDDLAIAPENIIAPDVADSITYDFIPELPSWLTSEQGVVNGSQTSIILKNPIDPTTQNPIYPKNSDAGKTTKYTLVVTDNYSLSHSLEFSITVENKNDNPTFNETPVPDTSVNEDELYYFKPGVTDIDNNVPGVTETLEFGFEGDLPWATFNPETGELTGTPDNDDAGTGSGKTYSNLKITVSDNKDLNGNPDTAVDDSIEFSIVVIPVNDPPVMSCIVQPYVGIGGSFYFEPTVTGLDVSSEGNPDQLTFSISSQVPWLYFNSSNGSLTSVIQGRPDRSDMNSEDNPYSRMITVQDGNGGKDSCTIEFEVIEELTIEKGDLNGLDEVSLADVILGLQILVGIEDYVYMEADVNADNKIGMEEILYDLQVISEIREPIK